MTDARDELAALIMRAYREGGDAYRATDAILAAGWIKNEDAPPIGLLQVLSPDHPLVKYGSWDKAPDDKYGR